MNGTDNAPIVLAQQPGPAQVATLETFALDATKILARKAMLHQVMETVMKEGVHYGKIPGCGDKPSLLKPGAEAISSTFQLCPRYTVQRTDLDGGHREYEVTCELYNPAGGFIGSGVGSATTMEGKYRYRVGGGEATDIQVPKSYWDTRKSNPKGAAQILRDIANQNGVEGQSFGTQKVDSVWMITTKGDDAKIEHDNPADYYNTVLKMGKKRAFVDAVLTATGASDIFTQDIEDMPETITGARHNQARPQQHGNQGYANNQSTAMSQMDDIPDYGPTGGGEPQHVPLTDQQKRKVFGSCKGKNIDLDALCLSLTDNNSFGRKIMRVTDLSKQEASQLIGWIDDGVLDFLSPAAA